MVTKSIWALGRVALFLAALAISTNARSEDRLSDYFGTGDVRGTKTLWNKAALKAAFACAGISPQTPTSEALSQVQIATMWQSYAMLSEDIDAGCPSPEELPNARIFADPTASANLIEGYRAAYSYGETNSPDLNTADTRVLNGAVATNAKATVSITYSTPDPIDGGSAPGLCTGSLIGRKAVLTALHCVCAATAHSVRLGVSVGGKAYDAHRVETYVNCPDAPDQLSFTRGQFKGRDLALIILNHDVPAKDVPNLAKIATPDEVAQWSGKSILVIGYGWNSTQGEGAGIRRLADVAVATRACASPELVSYYDCAFNKEIVGIGYLVDTCPGDSGGPAYIKKSSGQHRVAAITSWALEGQHGCGAGGYYTLIDAAVRQWLNSVMAAPP